MCWIELKELGWIASNWINQVGWFWMISTLGINVSLESWVTLQDLKNFMRLRRRDGMVSKVYRIREWLHETSWDIVHCFVYTVHFKNGSPLHEKRVNCYLASFVGPIGPPSIQRLHSLIDWLRSRWECWWRPSRRWFQYTLQRLLAWPSLCDRRCDSRCYRYRYYFESELSPAARSGALINLLNSSIRRQLQSCWGEACSTFRNGWKVPAATDPGRNTWGLDVLGFFFLNKFLTF